MVANLNAAPCIHASVTLNLFQGLAFSGTCAGTDKWMLKRVQHDDFRFSVRG
jgi:hypothetical protein